MRLLLFLLALAAPAFGESAAAKARTMPEECWGHWREEGGKADLEIGPTCYISGVAEASDVVVDPAAAHVVKDPPCVWPPLMMWRTKAGVLSTVLAYDGRTFTSYCLRGDGALIREIRTEDQVRAGVAAVTVFIRLVEAPEGNR